MQRLGGLHQADLQKLPWGLHLHCAHEFHRLDVQPDTSITAATEQHQVIVALQQGLAVGLGEGGCWV